MRIAFVVSEFPNLSETFVLDQIVGMIERGHDVEVFADRPGNTSTIAPEIGRYGLLQRTTYWEVSPKLLRRAIHGLRLLASGVIKNARNTLRSLNWQRYGLPSASLIGLHAVAKTLSKKSYDVLQCHFGPCGLLASMLRDLELINGRVVTTFHGYDVTRHVKKHGTHLYDFLFDSGDLMLPVSDAFRRRLIALGCDAHKIIVHHVGVHCNLFAMSERHAAPTEKVRFVSVARLAEKKGLYDAIRAFAIVAKKIPQLEFSIVGDGPQRSILEQLIKELDVTSAVRLLGWKSREQIAEILRHSHIMLAPSITAEDGDQEGIPTTLMEAAAVGLPVISTRHSGIPELVEDGVSGYLVAEKDVDALAERIEHLVTHPELWPQLGRAGRRIVEERFNIQRLNDDLENIYRDLISRPRRD